MVSPYLMKRIRSFQEASKGARVRNAVHDEGQTWSQTQGQAEAPQSTVKAEGPGVQILDSRLSANASTAEARPGPRLVWTNAAREPAVRDR